MNIVVDVAFKLFIDNVELVDNEVKLLNIVVEVAFKLFIDNVELVDNEFKLLNVVVDVVFKLLINNIDDDDKKVDEPETNRLLKLVLLFINSVELVDNEFKLLNMVVDVAFRLLINNLELVE